MASRKGKKAAGLCALLAVCGGLFAAYGILNKQNAEKEEEETTAADEEKASLFEFDKDQIVSVSYEKDSDTKTFTRKDADSDWTYEKDPTLPITQNDINSLVNSVSAVSIQKEIGKEVNLADFGLSDPSAVLTMRSSDGTEYELMLGDASASSASYLYAMNPENGNVVTISSNIGDKMPSSIYDLCDLDEYPSFTTDDMKEIHISDPDGTFELVKEPEDLSIADAIGTSQWYFERNGHYQATDYNNCLAFVKQAAGISFDSCVKLHATEEELSSYGLGNDAVTLFVKYQVEDTEAEEAAKEALEAAESNNSDESGTENSESEADSTEETTEAPKIYKDQEVEIKIGNKTEEEDSYYVSVKNGEYTDVYLVSKDKLDSLLNEDLSTYLISRMPCMLNFTGLKKAEASYDGKTLELLVEQKTSKDEDGKETTTYTCTLNGQEEEESDARKVFSKLIKPTADKVLPESADTEGDPLFTCRFETTFEDRPELTYEIYPYDSTYYLLKADGESRYLITKTEYETLIENLAESWK